MRTLIHYAGLAEHIHQPVDQLIRDLSDRNNYEKARRRNPEYFIDITDDFEKFFIEWRAADATRSIALERRMLDRDKQFSKLEHQIETTNFVLGEMLPILLSLQSKAETMSQHTDKLQQDVETLVPLVNSLVGALKDANDAKNELMATKAAGLADDAAIDLADQKISDAIQAGQDALNVAAAPDTAPTVIDAPPPAPEADGKDAPLDPTVGGTIAAPGQG